MCRCDRCDRVIDSDEDVDCFIDIDKPQTVIACESCRDDMEESGELDLETNTLRLDYITQRVIGFSAETLRECERLEKEST
jgi:hypothetical protein